MLSWQPSRAHSAPVEKITIVPRTSGALGYTMQVDEGNHYLMSKEEIENKIATLTGGRAAEEADVRLHHDGSVQRYRAGDQTGKSHDYAVWHERATSTWLRWKRSTTSIWAEIHL